MKASINLLKQFIDLENISVQEIAAKLTFSGLEVEGIEYLAKGTNLVIGQIIELENHPSSDHLHVLKVDLGPKYGVTKIVCGAKNVVLGMKVIVARVGAKIGFDDIEIKKGVIRGVESNGMCCSLVELGVDKSLLSEEQINGIERLPDDSEVGNEHVLEYLHLDDVILDINVLANRSDCLAILSLAKELKALFSRKLTLPEAKEFNTFESKLKIDLRAKKCYQFSLVEARDIVVKESPIWLKNYLRSEGIRSINNIVDIGNYLMILNGQPLHMYDLDEFNTDTFIVDDEYDGSFTALNDKEYSLVKGDIVIRSRDSIGCLGGVMGAKSCFVNENSKNIAIEVASFDGASVRHTSKRLGLSSDSSSRFIKGINPSQAHYVLNLAMQLIESLAEGKSFSNIIEVDKVDHSKTVIKTTFDYINHRLGTNFSSSQIGNTLSSLGITIESDEDNLTCTIPDHRIDIKCDADLSEEVIRLIGLDNVKSTLPSMETTIGGYDEEKNKREKIREHLIARGLNEVLTYSLVSKEENVNLIPLNSDQEVKILNPMTSDHEVLRRGLIPSLIKTLKYNLDHQNENISIFEISEITTENETFEELAVLLNGKKMLQGLLRDEPYSFYDVKGIFESILKILNIDATRLKIKEYNSSADFNPYQSAGVYLQNKLVAVIGMIHPSISKDYGDTYVLDILLDSLLNLKTSKKKMEKISKYPSRNRDYCFIVKKDIKVEEIITLIKKFSKGIIKNVQVFDVYALDDSKSVALRVTYQSLEKTLSDSDINPIENNILTTLQSKLGAYLRD